MSETEGKLSFLGAGINGSLRPQMRFTTKKDGIYILTIDRIMRIGVLAPLARPGWIEAGTNLLAGLRLGASDINEAGGVAGRPIELLVRDTAADPDKAIAAIVEFARSGVAAIAGEFHSTVARAAADRCHALQIPFLCSSAVSSPLSAEPTDWVGRLAPAQTRGWAAYADFLIRSGHRRIAVVTTPSSYWAKGIEIVRQSASINGASVTEIAVGDLTAMRVAKAVAAERPSIVLLLVGMPDPVVSIVRAIRSSSARADFAIGAPAGQPEFATWLRSLGIAGVGIPFLRYLPEQLTQQGKAVTAILREQLGETPSFVALEGYDTIVTLARLLRCFDSANANIGACWRRVSFEGTRGRITFSWTPGSNVWEWPAAPIQVVERDPERPDRIRVLAQAA